MNMSEAVAETAQEVDYLSMSDEELMNMPEPGYPASDTPEEEDPAVNQENDESDEAEAAADQGAAASPDEDEVLNEEDNQAEIKPTGKADEGGESKEVSDKETKKTETVDYEAEYKKLFTPFKANGKDIQVESVEDAITLMQMGANYNKKMAALKPNLKLMKMLENNQLLSEEKISFLIELDKKNPDAINKLVQDSGINPMDFDADKAGEYRPRIHTVDDRELALDSVLDSIQDTPTYARTLDIVSKEWDGASKQMIADHPQLLEVINDHVARGVYDLIAQAVEREQMLGRLTGLSSFEAYRQVGDAIQARGGFDHLGSPQGNTDPTKPRVVTPKPKADDSKLKEQKRAASSSKPGSSVPAVDGDYNPLSMSDEEFAKISDKYR